MDLHISTAKAKIQYTWVCSALLISAYNFFYLPVTSNNVAEFQYVVCRKAPSAFMLYFLNLPI